MVIAKRFRLEKNPFSACSRPLTEQAVEYQRKYCKKMYMYTKKEKQNNNTPTGDPLQQAGSEVVQSQSCDSAEIKNLTCTIVLSSSSFFCTHSAYYPVS